MKKNKAGGWVESAILCKVIRKVALSLEVTCGWTHVHLYTRILPSYCLAKKSNRMCLNCNRLLCLL